MKNTLTAALIICAVLLSRTYALAYPLDDGKRTGIARLDGYFFSLKTRSGSAIIPPGARLTSAWVKPHLEGQSFPVPAADPAFSRQLSRLLGGEANSYGVAVLDITDPKHPYYAAHNADRPFMQASVGKVLVALAIFQSLADIYPSDIAKREKILRETQITADEFIRSDTHEVPFWHRAEVKIEHRPLQEGDRANLWSYLDWMLSASSNAAANMVIKQLLLLDRFREQYPPSFTQAADYFDETPPARLAAQMRSIMRSTIARNGLPPESIMHVSMFTREAKKRVPASGSIATPRELLRYLLLLEQGRLVDKFSSRELKRLLYMTQQRMRYANSRSLLQAAVYFKSGSNFHCKPERNFTCTNYHGNVENLMNSIAIVEYPAVERRYVYMVVITSNVLRRDSSEAHAQLAAGIQGLIERRHARTR